MTQQAHLVDFLEQELAVSPDAIALGLRQTEAFPSLLPIVLWQYGILNIHQLDQTFAWLGNQTRLDLSARTYPDSLTEAPQGIDIPLFHRT